MGDEMNAFQAGASSIENFAQMLPVLVRDFGGPRSMNENRKTPDTTRVCVCFPVVFDEFPIGRARQLTPQPCVQTGKLIGVTFRTAVWIPTVNQHDEFLSGCLQPRL